MEMKDELQKLKYEDSTQAEATAAEQWAVAYVAQVGATKETMVDALSTLRALVMAYDRKLQNTPSTGSLGGDQDRIDISNLRFYSQMAREFQWQTDVIHWSVIEQTLSEVAQRTEAALAQKTRECEEQERDWWVRLGKFRKALHEAGLHGHYNLLQEHFEDESGQWERLVAERYELRAQVEQLQRQVAEMDLRLNYCQFDHTTPERFRGRGRGASAYKAAFESAWRGREFDGELYAREPHRSAWRKGYIDGQQAFALASRARTK